MKLTHHLVPARPVSRWALPAELVPMRILLRNSKSGLYYQDPGQSTENPKEARVFGHTAQAIELVYQMNLPDMEVLLTFEEAAHNIRFPLQLSPES